jgi:hypothetical protein
MKVVLNAAEYSSTTAPSMKSLMILLFSGLCGKLDPSVKDASMEQRLVPNLNFQYPK